MNIGLDIDGTIDAFPQLFQHLIAGWSAAGDHVYIITGVTATTVTDADHAAKAGYLTALGISPESYYQLIICPIDDTGDHAANKLKVLEDNNIHLLIDNDVNNCKAAKTECAVFLLYNVKKKGDVGTSVQKNDSPHTHEHRAGQMCCDGRTAAQHRATSSDGKCCTDAKVSVDGTDTQSLTGTK